MKMLAGSIEPGVLAGILHRYKEFLENDVKSRVRFVLKMTLNVTNIKNQKRVQACSAGRVG